MTFQVALCHRDGIVFASDECETRLNLAPGGVGSRETMTVDKIRIVGPNMVMFAGDDYSREAASRIARSTSSKPDMSVNPEPGLDQIAREVHGMIPKEGTVAITRRREVTSVIGGKLWQTLIAANPLSREIHDKATAGDPGNTARFLTECYYADCNSLESLKLLAVHAVLMAARLSSAVAGIAVAVSRPGRNPEFLGENEMETLLALSRTINDRTVALLRDLST
jgi:hypothetical protein